jgi:DNA-binding response OmpR family regulator
VVIEDDPDIRALLATVLTQAGFDAITAGNGLDGIEAVRQHDPIVTTLDVTMPGMDGFETARRIRDISSTYIVMITAMGDEIDAMHGFDSGADDYVSKPFRPRELRARVEAMMRRPRTIQVDAPADPTRTLEHNGVTLDPATRIAQLGGAELELTRSEFDLLEGLMNSGRRVRTKADLVLLLRGRDYVASDFVSDSDKRALEVHMANLRKKLGESAVNPQWVETVRGVGYRLTASDVVLSKS